MGATILGALLEVSSWGCFREGAFGGAFGARSGVCSGVHSGGAFRGVFGGALRRVARGCSGGVRGVFGRYIATAVGLHIFIILLPTRADGLSVPRLNSWWKARGKKFQRYRGQPD